MSLKYRRFKWLDMSTINNIFIFWTYRKAGIRSGGEESCFSQTKRQSLVMYSRPTMQSAVEDVRQSLAHVDIVPTPSIKAFDFCKRNYANKISRIEEFYGFPFTTLENV